jgi:hypothetical protein
MSMRLRYSVGAETANVIRVTARLSRAGRRTRAALWMYLSDDAEGDGLIATAPDGGVAAGTKGAILAEPVADKVLLVQFDRNGEAELAITHAAGAKTLYVVGIMPNGALQVSGAVTFAA